MTECLFSVPGTDLKRSKPNSTYLVERLVLGWDRIVATTTTRPGDTNSFNTMQARLIVYASTFVRSCSSLFESRVLTSYNPHLVHQNTSSSPISINSRIAKQRKFSCEILCSLLR